MDFWRSLCLFWIKRILAWSCGSVAVHLLAELGFEGAFLLQDGKHVPLLEADGPLVAGLELYAAGQALIEVNVQGEKPPLVLGPNPCIQIEELIDIDFPASGRLVGHALEVENDLLPLHA